MTGRKSALMFKQITASLFLAGLSGLPVSEVIAQEGPSAAEYGVVLNLSGKQRMLTQKMSKEVVLVALDHDKAANLDNLKKTSALFDRTLKGLREGDADLKLPPTTARRITRQLDKTQALWTPFNEKIQAILAAGQVGADDVQFIAEQNLPLLQEMNRCVKLYEADAAKAGLQAAPGLAVTINLAGKQRMLTQKMSKEFLLVAYGSDGANNRLNLQETAGLFERTLAGLLDGDATLDLPGTKPENIRQQLGVVENLWKDFKPHIEFAMNAENTSVPADRIGVLASSNLPLLAEMNKAVKLYEQEAGK